MGIYLEWNYLDTCPVKECYWYINISNNWIVLLEFWKKYSGVCYQLIMTTVQQYVQLLDQLVDFTPSKVIRFSHSVVLQYLLPFYVEWKNYNTCLMKASSWDIYNSTNWIALLGFRRKCYGISHQAIRNTDHQNFREIIPQLTSESCSRFFSLTCAWNPN